MRRFGNVAVISSTIGALLLLGAPHAAAATAKYMSLNSSIKSVKTSSGKSLHLTVMAFKNTTTGNTSKASVTIYLTTGASPFSVGETHGFSFQLPRSDFSYSAPTGKLSSASSSGSKLGAYGSMSLKFSKTSQSSRHCKLSGSMTTIKGSLKGSFHFSTKTSAWGSVGGSSFSFATPNFMFLSSGCNDGGGGTQTCFSGLNWSGPTASAFTSGSSMTISGGTKSNIISVNRNVTLSKPSGATRSDSLNEPAQALTVDSTGHLVIKTKSGTHVTGNAKISKGTTTPKSTSPCKTAGGASKTLTNVSHFSATWSSPSSSRLTFHFAITPDFVAPGTGSASWTKFSYA
jgi:hypothetical protein